MFFSEKKNQFKSFTRRSFILISAKLTLLILVIIKLFNLQIKESEKYKTLSKKNRIDFKLIYPERGLVLDSSNTVLAKNYNKYDLYIIPEEIKNMGLLLKNLSKTIKITFKQRKKAISLSKKLKKFEMIKIVEDLNWTELEKVETNMIDFSGVHLISSPKRYYSYGRHFSHVIGYTSKPSEIDMKLPYISSMPKLEVGKIGIEKQFNEILIGKPGIREIEVNSEGREIREISSEDCINGQNIELSLNLKIQKVINEQFNNLKSGSIVLMNIHNGEIIGMGSYPDFNPNKIIAKPNKKYWEGILSNELGPLNNRAIQGLYAPGSTFKMIVALAALKNNVIGLNENIFCKGKIEFGERFYHCWKTKGHGKVNLIKGIKESCDCYFYELSKRVGIDKIALMAEEFNFGKETKIELPSEKSGINPNKKWKKKNLKENWYAGETLISGIGQGYILCTPIQLATMISILANGGKKIKPTLIKKGLQDKSNINETKNINVSNDHLKIIEKAMIKVVNESGGTAFSQRSNFKDYNFGGKTGTSQVKKITLSERESEDFRKKEIEWKNKDHALFVGYMPINKPKYAISVVVEHGGSGSSTAAPIARKIFDEVHKQEV